MSLEAIAYAPPAPMPPVPTSNACDTCAIMVWARVTRRSTTEGDPMNDKKIEDIRGNDVCMCLHTALRKCCDSRITTAAYNLVHLICDSQLPEEYDPWRLYGELVAIELNKPHRVVARSKADIQSCAITAAKRLDDTFMGRRAAAREAGVTIPSRCTTSLHALVSTLECFDAKDWKGFVGYLP